MFPLTEERKQLNTRSERMNKYKSIKSFIELLPLSVFSLTFYISTFSLDIQQEY